MKIGDRIFVRGYIDEIRKDTVIVRNDGGYFGTILSEIITGELPSAQLEKRTQERTETHACDLIDREAAIEAMSESLKRVFPEHRQIAGKCLKALPSAQPEIIRCAECKWYGRADKRRFYRDMDCLQKHIDTIVPDRDFCSKAERRTDESNMQDK